MWGAPLDILLPKCLALPETCQYLVTLLQSAASSIKSELEASEIFLLFFPCAMHRK
jgi:hypothetical protein